MTSLKSIWVTWACRLIVVFIMYLIVPCSLPAMAGEQKPSKNMNVPAIFAFGDSLVDAGNNNFLPLSPVKCNFPPNGKDFSGSKATGRFCNGRLTTDFLVEKFGIKKSLPAFLDTSLPEEELLTGVSFASAGSGYDPFTAHLVLTRSLDVQLEWFKQYRKKIKAVVGADRTRFIVNNSVYFLVSGTCDLANTYYTIPFRRLFQDLDSFTNTMLDGATSFIKRLYKMGARTIAISNVPPFGYLPSQRTLGGGPTRKCPEYYNEAAQIFNLKLQARIIDLRRKLYMSTLIYIDTYSFFLDIVLNSTTYGFKVVDRGCCGSGFIEVAIFCNPFSLVCDSKYLFWDSFHPSEAAYELIANQIMFNYFPHLSSEM
ncbi:hypothetical protein RND81_03G006600 [Saponaria officinalis]|uniref:Uncharacterized protein n=1 Tax=Saponaria officinalis TaxID=3572 RepID=A0AAW1M3A1_SAPOF